MSRPLFFLGLVGLLNDLPGQVVGNFFVVRKRHLKSPPTAGHGPQVGRVGQNLGHWHRGLNNLRVAPGVHVVQPAQLQYQQSVRRRDDR